MQMKLQAKLSLLALATLCLVAGVLMNYVVPLKSRLGPPILPIQSLRVAIGTEDQKQFTVQFTKFSDANGFTMYVSQVTPDPRDIVIELRRDDVVVNASDPFSPSEFSIAFYKNFYKNGAMPPPVKVIDDLTKSLESFVPGIQNDPPRQP
jgi:hypothetical protein